jgi:hypothetical protein
MNQSSIIDEYLSKRPWGDIDTWRREKCDCGSTCRFYCSKCRKLVGAPLVANHMEIEPLPLKVDIILRDDQTKATGIHASILAPGSTRLIEFSEGVRYYYAVHPIIHVIAADLFYCEMYN